MKNLKILAIFIIVLGLFAPLFKLTQSVQKEQPLSIRSMSLDKRYNDSFVNSVFKDNILLTLRYLNNEKFTGNSVDWNKINKPYSFDFKIEPNSVFAFHDGILPEFKDKVTKTTNAHFNSSEGFKSDGYLIGDGVCHLASLINWAARDAGLNVVSPTNHDFANIPEVPKEYGVSIYSQPIPTQTTLMQNLYIKNNLDKTVIMKFNFDGENLKVEISKTGASIVF